MSEIYNQLAQNYNAVLNQLDSNGNTYAHLQLMTANMTFSDARINHNTLNELLCLDIACGWFMYGDRFETKPTHGSTFLLEAEWVVGDNSFHAMHLGNGEYALTNYICGGNDLALYRDVSLVGRHGGSCTYRTWWQVLEDGSTQCHGQQLIAMEEA